MVPIVGEMAEMREISADFAAYRFQFVPKYPRIGYCFWEQPEHREKVDSHE